MVLAKLWQSQCTYNDQKDENDAADYMAGRGQPTGTWSNG